MLHGGVILHRPHLEVGIRLRGRRRRIDALWEINVSAILDEMQKKSTTRKVHISVTSCTISMMSVSIIGFPRILS